VLFSYAASTTGFSRSNTACQPSGSTTERERWSRTVRLAQRAAQTWNTNANYATGSLIYKVGGPWTLAAIFWRLSPRVYKK
jgi:hypothetical protein